MSGYFGYSMSNNAVTAYECGEKPLSKWRKYEIIAELESQNLPDEIMKILCSLPFSVLKSNVLVKTSWHHTSSMYNKTSFYSVDDLTCVTAEEIKNWSSETHAAKDKRTFKARAEWIEWEGRFVKYKKPVRYEAIGTVIGNWFFPDNSKKKKLVNGNSFKILEVL